MSFRITGAVAQRVLRQLRHDPRTIALILLVPCLLEFLLQQLFGRHSPVFQQIGTPLLGMFPFITMFLVTSITMLRERTSGTLERLMTMPLHKVDILAGYAAAFALLALIQATLISAVAFGCLGWTLPARSGWWSRWRWRTRSWKHARPLRQRVRADRVPSGAVHARLCAPADPSLRTLRRSERDDNLAPCDLVCHAADVRLRRARPHRGQQLRHALRAQCGRHLGCVVLAIVLGGAAPEATDRLAEDHGDRSVCSGPVSRNDPRSMGYCAWRRQT